METVVTEETKEEVVVGTEEQVNAAPAPEAAPEAAEEAKPEEAAPAEEGPQAAESAA